MIPRTTASTSADASRLAARKARKRSVKSGARRSRRIGMALSYRRARATGNGGGGGGRPPPAPGWAAGWVWGTGGRPGGPPPARPGSPHSAPVPAPPPPRENEIHAPGGRIGLGKFDRQQVEHRVLAGGIDVSALAAFDALEAQRRAATSEFGLCPLGGEPVEAAQRYHQALFVRTPHDGGHLDERILQMRGHDFEVVPVKGDELHRLHDARSLPFSALWR